MNTILLVLLILTVVYLFFQSLENSGKFFSGIFDIFAKVVYVAISVLSLVVFLAIIKAIFSF